MSINVPPEVLSELVTACKTNDFSLVLTSPGQNRPSITIHYDISKGNLSSWFARSSKAGTHFGTTVALPIQSTDATGSEATRAASVAVSTTHEMSRVAEAAAKSPSRDPSRSHAVSRTEEVVSKCRDHWNRMLPVLSYGAEWFGADWLQKGEGTGEVSEEAATILAQSLARAWRDEAARQSATDLTFALSGYSLRGLPVVEGWLNSLAQDTGEAGH